MKDMISLFILNVLHPFQIQHQLREDKTLAQPSLALVGGDGETEEDAKPRWTLSFVEFLSISWIFIIINALYELISLNWGVMLSEDLFEGQMSSFFLSSMVRFSRVHSLMSVLFSVVFFPLSLWLYAKFWEMIITFFAQLFKVNESRDSIKEVVNQSFAGHIMLIIPIIGLFIRHVAGLIYIYAGLRENLGMSKAQASIVIVSPIILFLLMGLVSFLSFAMMILNLLYL